MTSAALYDEADPVSDMARCAPGGGVAPVLQAQSISKAYAGTQALDDVSLDVQPGEVHALVGENGAGKTTLLNVLSGVVMPDGGDIRVRGRRVRLTTPRQAQELGIGTVFQELSLVPGVSVAENVFSNRAPTRHGGFIRWSELFARTRELMAEFGVEIDVRTPVGDLPVGTRQQVEIAKALSLDARILLLDEPSSALTPDEVATLFGVLRRLKASGIGIIYVSHRMPEVFEVADRITVLRDGRRLGTYATVETSPGEVVRLMVGRELSATFVPRKGETGEELLRVQGLSKAGAFHDIDLTLRRGEIVGLAGLRGSGRGELARILAGVNRPTAGAVRIDGKPASLASVAAAVELGIAYLPEERARDGLFPEISIEDNMIVTALKRFSRFGLIDPGKKTSVAKAYVSRLDIRAAGVKQPVARLSGGNQQKVLLAKWLVTEPRILLVHEPTKGIDIGAKHEIHLLLRDLADGGAGIVVISAEIPELIRLCDRIVVMHEGRITGEVAAQAASEEAIMALASGLSAAPTADEAQNENV